MSTPSKGIGRGYGNTCLDCRQRYHAKVHKRGNRVYTHDYVAPTKAERRADRANAPRLCDACAAGRHTYRSEITCLNVVGKEPRDFVCGCPVCKDGSYLGRVPVSFSDSQGVISCRVTTNLLHTMLPVASCVAVPAPHDHIDCLRTEWLAAHDHEACEELLLSIRPSLRICAIDEEATASHAVPGPTVGVVPYCESDFVDTLGPHSCCEIDCPKKPWPCGEIGKVVEEEV